jgi:hypothetical protein
MKFQVTSLILMILGVCTPTILRAQDRTTHRPIAGSTPASNSQISTSSPEALPAAARQPVILNFDTLPNADWVVSDCFGTGSGTVSHGILTINSPSDCYEYGLNDPKGIWNKFVSNSRGWTIETGLKLDPVTQSLCDLAHGSTGVEIFANDHTILIILGFASNEICLAYPDPIEFPMDTTDAFHIYRVEAKGLHLQIFVDGNLAIDHVLSNPGSGTQGLFFGDGDFLNTSVSYWDYLSYNVAPQN